MPTKLKFRRGTTAELQNMVGQDGEIFIDTDKNVPVIQDGITPGGHPLISEEYLLENSLPPKTGDGGADDASYWKGEYNPLTIYVENDIVTYLDVTSRRRSTLPGVSGYDPTNTMAWDIIPGFDKTYLNVQDGESVWKELSILPEGSVVSVSSDMFLPESDFLKLDGSIKPKQEYPALASIFGNIPVADYVGVEATNLYRWRAGGEYISDNENMVFDGTYYIRIVGQYDPNYNIYRTTNGTENPYGDLIQFYPSWTVGATYVDGTQFKVQRSLDGYSWNAFNSGNTFTVAPFSNNATRCKSISAGTDGVIYMLVDRITDLVDSTLTESYSSLLVKSEDHGSTWQEVSLGDFNSRLTDDESIKKVKYIQPKKVNPTNLIEWQPETQYAINTLLYHKDVIYRVQSIIGSPTTPITAANAPQFRSGQQDDGDYVLVFEEFYDRGCVLLPSNDGYTDYLISVDAGETFTPLSYPQIEDYGFSRKINIIDTPSGTYLYKLALDRTSNPFFNDPNHYFYFIKQDSIQTPNLNQVGLYYFTGGLFLDVNLPLTYGPSEQDFNFYGGGKYSNEPTSCYNEETNQIIFAYTHNSDTILLMSVDSSESLNTSFTVKTLYSPNTSLGKLDLKFYSKIITSPDFDATKAYINPGADDYTTWKTIGIVKLHWSPIYGTMVFMKNKIYYSTDPASLQWNVVGNIEPEINNNFVSCINTPDGVLVSCRDRVYYIKNGDSFALPTIQDDVSLSYPTSYYVKI